MMPIPKLMGMVMACQYYILGYTVHSQHKNIRTEINISLGLIIPPPTVVAGGIIFYC